jgi:transposase-like protein
MLTWRAIENHLEETGPTTGNRRNRKMRKQVKTEYGLVEVETPHDRNSNFNPEKTRKR